MVAVSLKKKIDVEAAKRRGIVVTHTPDVLNDDVADMALGLMLSISRKMPQADRFVRNNDWVDGPFPLTKKMTGARLGLVGIGRIGQAIARRAQAFDMLDMLARRLAIVCGTPPGRVDAIAVRLRSGASVAE